MVKESLRKETEKVPSTEQKTKAPVGQGMGRGTPGVTRRPTLELPRTVTVRQLADILGVSAIDVIKDLLRLGIVASINQVIEYQVAATIAAKFGYEVKPETRPALAAIAKKPAPAAKEAGLQPRPPVVVVMGHVDHGKTRLLDAIRQTNVMAREAGAITQHIGAYQVDVNGQKITFLDTPGHEAFTTMRARGAQVADITVLVVAADDGVMPQTLEAIDHSRAAGVPIVVAINKIDKPEANPEQIKQQLADTGLVVEEWGGDTIAVKVSARDKTGIPDLLENILLVAEILELKASPFVPAEGVVIEARLDRARGPLATIIVQNGTLHTGDIVVAGATWGKVKALFNDKGNAVRHAGPSDPVEVMGLSSLPQVGDLLKVVPGEQQARALAEKRQQEMVKETGKPETVSLARLSEQISAGKIKELNVIIKTDVQGSIEPLRNSIEPLSTEEVQVKVIRSATGNISESDVMLASASRALIIGFGVSADPAAKRLAEREGIDVRVYNVIYDIVDDIKSALKGMVAPKFMEVIEGRGQIIAAFPLGKTGRIAGIRITEGKVRAGISARIIRNGQVLRQSTVTSLKHYQEFVKEVTAGKEAGVVFQDFKDFEVGDTVEFFSTHKAG